MAKLNVRNRYGVTPHEVLNNLGLSWKAKGLYGYIQSKPDGWDFAIERFEGKDGKDGTRAGVLELEKLGYLTRIKTRQDDGTWDWEYTLYERPEDNPYHGGKPAMDEASTMAENPSTENPSLENPPYIKEGNTNKDIQRSISLLSQEDFENVSLIITMKIFSASELFSKRDIENMRRAELQKFLRELIKVDKFKDENEWTELGKILKLHDYLGKDVFVHRLRRILSDNFKLGNSNRLSYLRKEIESFVGRTSQEFTTNQERVWR